MANYDTLTIKIVANTAWALNNIERLEKHLSLLEEQAKKMDLGRMEDVKNLLEQIARIDFSNVAGGLYNITKSFEAFNNKNFGKTFSLVAEESQAFKYSVETALAPMEQLNTTVLSASADFGKLTNEIEKTKTVIGLTEKESVKFYETLQKFNDLKNLNLADTLGGARSNDFLGLFTIKSLSDVKKNFVELDTAINTLKANWDGSISTLEKFGDKLSEIGLNGSQIENVLSRLGQEQVALNPQQIAQVEQLMEQLGYSAEETRIAVADLTKEFDKMSKQGQSGLSKLAGKFKSLALYRIMRLILMQIQQAFQQGIQDLAKESQKFNEAISKIKSSFTYIANSLVSLIAPILIVIAPIVEEIAKFVGDIVNFAGQLVATGLGQAEFEKAKYAVDDYAASLKKAKNVSLGIDELNVIQKDDETDRFGAISTGISESRKGLEGLGKVLGRIFDTIRTIISTVYTLLQPLFEFWQGSMDSSFAAFDTILGSIMDGLGAFIELFRGMVALLKGDWATFGQAMKNVFEGAVNAIVQGFVAFVNLFVDIINAITQGISSIWTWTGLPGIPEIPHWEVEHISFATGGFPEDGMFFANHNELIGQFNDGRTVVANNEQIIEGIKQGVYEAMMMSQGGDSKGSPSVVVYLDSREIAARVQERTDARKDNGLSGGYKYVG